MVKLNIGSGLNKMEGYTNVDKYASAEPDVIHDLEIFPWPFEDNSVEEVHANHVMEHLADVCGVMKEIYRVCKHGAKVQINVPSPTHRDWLGDPTHVSHIIPETMYLFSKKACDAVKAQGGANSPLAYYLGCDFDVYHIEHMIDAAYKDYVERRDPGFDLMARNYWNVIQAHNIQLRVIKEYEE